ncbi:MAG: universal stress protein [Desulfobacterales bacterium]
MLLPKVAIKKILFATDLSEGARQALAYAVSLSNRYGAPITILHALEESAGVSAAVMYHIGPDLWNEIKKKHEDTARNVIIAKQREDDPAVKEALHHYYNEVSQSFEEQAFTLEDVVVKRGRPVDLIVETAERRRCDLIVMGTRGQGGLTQMMLGSTAQKVLKRSKIPVLVVCPQPAPPA